jgi:nitrogen fixation NifU-like protein
MDSITDKGKINMTALDQEIIEHMANPRNYGTMEQADAIGIGENPENGEKVIIHLRVNDEGEEPVIEDIRFQAIGCMTTVVAGSIITGEAKGIDFATGRDLISVTLGMLDDVPPEEAACSEMVALSLQAAMDTYTAQKTDPDHGTIMYKIENSCVVKEEDQ